MSNKFNFWAGDLQSYFVALDVLNRIQTASVETAASVWDRGDNDDEDDFDGYGYMIQKVGSTAVITVAGQLVPQSNWMTRFFGLTGYDEIRNAMVAVVNEGTSNSILMDIKSPGGATEGLDDMTSFIKQVDTELLPVYGHSSGTMASAAYRIGAASRELYATKMASVGSIGVVAVHQEITKMLEDHGVNVTVLRAGKYKMLGNPYEKLSATAVEVIQGQLDYLYADFTEEVAQNRGLPLAHVQDNAAEGQVFFGEEAAALRLTDGVESFEGVVKRLDDIHNSPNGGSAHQQLTGTQAMLRKKLVISAEARAAIASGVPEEEAVAAYPAAPDPAPAAAAAGELDPPAPAAADPVPPAADADPAPAPAASGTTAEPAAADGDDNGGSAASVSLQFMQTQLKSTQDELVEARVENNRLTTQLATAENALPILKEIAIGATHKMQVGLGQAPVDLSAMTADAVIAQFQATESVFNERFHIGATAKPPIEADGNPSQKATHENQADSAATRATAFQKEVKR